MSQSLYNEYEQPLRLRLKPSKRLAFLIHGFHFLGAISGFILPVAIPMQFLLCSLVLVSWRQACLAFCSIAGGHFIGRLEKNVDNSLLIALSDGTEFAAKILPGTCLFSWWISLPLQLSSGEKRVCIILPDSLDGDAFRKLYRTLRLQIIIGRRHF